MFQYSSSLIAKNKLVEILNVVRFLLLSHDTQKRDKSLIKFREQY